MRRGLPLLPQNTDAEPLQAQAGAGVARDAERRRRSAGQKLPSAAATAARTRRRSSQGGIGLRNADFGLRIGHLGVVAGAIGRRRGQLNPRSRPPWYTRRAPPQASADM